MWLLNRQACHIDEKRVAHVRRAYTGFLAVGVVDTTRPHANSGPEACHVSSRRVIVPTAKERNAFSADSCFSRLVGKSAEGFPDTVASPLGHVVASDSRRQSGTSRPP